MDMKLFEKFNAVEASMNQGLLEREDEIHTSLLALACRYHHFQYGEPGVGKSMLVTNLCRHIEDLNGDYFQYLLTKFTTPEEIMGIMDLQAFKDGQYRKITDRKLPEAKIAFVDETLNGSSAILNAMLKILHERLFDRGDSTIEVPLISMFGASNHLPSGVELSALADRLQFWHWVRPIQDPSNRAQLLRGSEETSVEATITLDEIDQAHQEIQNITVPDIVIDSLLDIFNNLRESGVSITDRRFKQSVLIVRAEAWMRGREEATQRDLSPVQFTFWNSPDHLQKVSEIVTNEMSPIASEVREIRSDVARMVSSIKDVMRTSDERVEIISLGSDIVTKLAAAKNDIKALTNDNEEVLSEEDKEDLLNLRRYIQKQYDFIQGDVFGLTAIQDEEYYGKDSA